MFESIITISITGFIAGIIFAMPIAGPISILVTSNALKGRLRYSNLVTIGAAISDFIYIFIAVYGVTQLYHFFKPAMMYLFLAGAIFFFVLGLKLIRKPVDIEHFEETSHLTDRIKVKDRNAFYTGMMVNLLNPTVFFGGLTSSFFVISLIASLGLNTGGLELRLDNNVKEMNSIEGESIENSKSVTMEALNKIQEHQKIKKKERVYPPGFHLIISICYAFFISLGNIVWFYLLAYILVKYRKLINIKVLTGLIKTFGIILCIIGAYFGYLGAEKLLSSAFMVSH